MPVHISQIVSSFKRARITGLVVGLGVLSVAPSVAFAQSAPAAIVVAPIQVGDDTLSPEGSAESGYRSTTGSLGPLGDVAIKDTPYSITVTPGELIENRNAHTVADALQTNPTVVPLLVPNSVNSLSRIMIRGFSASDQNELRDGLVDRSFSYPPLENVERLDVLNGFSGFITGFSNPGGSINYVSKRPSSAFQGSVATGVYGGGIGYAQADFGGPVPATGNQLAYRLNAYHEDGDTFVDGGHQRRTLMSGAVDLHLAPDTVVTADLWHQDYLSTGLLTYFNANAGNWSGTGISVPNAKAFDATRQYGQTWTYNESEKDLATVGVQSKLNDSFTFRGAYRYGTMWREDSYIDGTLTNNSGSYTETAHQEPRQGEHVHAEYAMLDASAETLGIHHGLTAGYSGNDYYYKRANALTPSLGTSNIAAPITIGQPTAIFSAENNYQMVHSDNIVLGDRITFDPSWSALIGVTHARLQQNGWGSGVTISSANYAADKYTPTLALMYKPIPAVSTYVSYMQSLEQGDTAPGTAANALQVLPPSVSEQYEAGVKATLGEMDINAALFRIAKVNAETDPTDNTYKQDGTEIHQGLEVTATGKPLPRLTVVGGFTLMDAHVAKATADLASEGKIPVNVPEQEARAYAEYALPFLSDLTLTGGGNYFGRRPVDAHNTAFMDAAWTLDAGLRYQPEIYGHPVSFNLTVTNLLDKAYWAYYRTGDGLVLGEPRLVAFSVKAAW